MAFKYHFPKKLLLLLCLFNLLLFSSKTMIVRAEEQVKWTGNPEDSKEGNSGPLPLSSKQRQQLLQLEEVIRTAPNPDGTLKQAAEANGMSPQDLLSMLQRNRSDMEQGASANPMSTSIGHNLAKLFTTIFALITKKASKNPRAFALATTAFLILLLLAISAPRTGIVISRQRSLFSKGPTTVFQPPAKFLEKQIGSPKWQQRDTRSSEVSPSVWKDLMLPEDGTVWHTLPRKLELSKAATAQITIPVKSFVEEGADKEEDIEFVSDLCYNHAVDVISSRWLTEYVPEGAVKLHTLQNDGGRKRFFILVVKKLGDWGRFGLVPLQVTDKQENDTETSLTFSSLRAAHFTGQIHVSVQKQLQRKKDDAEEAIVLSVHLAMSKKGNKISRKAALKIVNSISTSMAASVRTRTRQSLARRGQSSRFRGKASERATERRTTRSKKEREIEEMAEDRRRRWQRNNPSSGRWRPSGDRMKSPNNC